MFIHPIAHYGPTYSWPLQNGINVNLPQKVQTVWRILVKDIDKNLISQDGSLYKKQLRAFQSYRQLFDREIKGLRKLTPRSIEVDEAFGLLGFKYSDDTPNEVFWIVHFFLKEVLQFNISNFTKNQGNSTIALNLEDLKNISKEQRQNISNFITQLKKRPDVFVNYISPHQYLSCLKNFVHYSSRPLLVR